MHLIGDSDPGDDSNKETLAVARVFHGWHSVRAWASEPGATR